jgi:hypothetical protein
LCPKTSIALAEANSEFDILGERNSGKNGNKKGGAGRRMAPP